MKTVAIFLTISLCVNNAVTQRLRVFTHSRIPNVTLKYFFFFYLEHYNVDPSTITVSGISSGAAMATQFHFAHSTQIVGAGIVAGGFYFYFDLDVTIKQ